MESRRVEIVEVGPRDGLQMQTPMLATAQKAEFIRRLAHAGLRRIEVTSFVNPRKVPQMADAEALMQALPRTGEIVYSGLVLNRKGFERARAAGCHEIGMVVVASETFNRRNQGVGIEESIAEWLSIARAAHEAGIRPQISISAACGCPFEGEVPADRVLEIAARVAEANPYEICIADTIGVGVPEQVRTLFSRLRAALPGTRLRGHFHNTRNTGLANAYAAFEAGASALDASCGGIGGCPFAPAATGNIATEDLVYMLDRSHIESGVSLGSLLETSQWLQEQLGQPVPGMLVKAGRFPRPAPL